MFDPSEAQFFYNDSILSLHDFPICNFWSIFYFLNAFHVSGHILFSLVNNNVSHVNKNIFSKGQESRDWLFVSPYLSATNAEIEIS